MSIPQSVVRFKSNNLVFTSSVDRVNYTIKELTIAAMRDVGKYLVRATQTEVAQLPGMKKSRRNRGKSSAITYWARKIEADLLIGYKHATWYAVDQELGSKNMRRHAYLQKVVQNNRDKIEEIEGKYLSKIEEKRQEELLKELEAHENDNEFYYGD